MNFIFTFKILFIFLSIGVNYKTNNAFGALLSKNSASVTLNKTGDITKNVFANTSHTHAAT